jgi:hypothetical protein
MGQHSIATPGRTDSSSSSSAGTTGCDEDSIPAAYPNTTGAWARILFRPLHRYNCTLTPLIGRQEGRSAREGTSVVLTALIVVFTLLLMGLWACAGVVALFVKDAVRRADAYKLLAGLVAGSGGAGGLITAAIKLQQRRRGNRYGRDPWSRAVPLRASMGGRREGSWLGQEFLAHFGLRFTGSAGSPAGRGTRGQTALDRVAGTRS